MCELARSCTRCATVSTSSTDQLHVHGVAAEKLLLIDLDLTVQPAGLNGTTLLGNGGSAKSTRQPDR